MSYTSYVTGISLGTGIIINNALPSQFIQYLGNLTWKTLRCNGGYLLPLSPPSLRVQKRTVAVPHSRLRTRPAREKLLPSVIVPKTLYLSVKLDWGN